MIIDSLIISTPLSESWPIWVMFGTMICLLLTEWQQPGTILNAFRTTFTRLERMYGDSGTSILGEIFLNTFRIGTIALAITLITYKVDFHFIHFAMVIGIIFAVMLLKMFLSWLVDFTFELRRTVAVYLPHYDNLWTVLAMLLYPVVLVYIHLSDNIVMPYLLGGIVAFFMLAVLIKLVMYFYNGVRSALYIGLYMITLEILPFALIVAAAIQL